MKQTVLEQLVRLRKVYEKELAEVQSKHEGILAKARKALKDAEEYNYAHYRTDRFEASLASLEKLYDNIAFTHKTTKGLMFHIDKYITTIRPRKIENGKVNEHFAKLVRECKEALAFMAHTETPEEDIEPSKKFAQGLVDLRFIVQNGKSLVEATGEPRELRKERMAECQAELDECERVYQNALKLENFACYEELSNFKEEILKNKALMQSRMLGNENENFGSAENYKFLMGFYTLEIDKESKKFITDVLELQHSDLSLAPIFFELTSGHSSILIKAPKKYFKSFDFDDLINNIYFSFVGSLPAKELLLTGVEAGTSEAVLGGLSMQVENYFGKEGMFHKVEDDFNGVDGILNCLKSIKMTAMDRSRTYRAKGNGIRDIFGYNESVAENRDKFILFIANHYPYGFNSGRSNAHRDLIELATEDGSKGIITIICEATDGEFDERTPMLSAEDLGADCIEITQDGETLYNDREASFDIRSEGFNSNAYWERLKSYFDNASSLWLKDVLKKAKNKQESVPIPPSYKEIRIPLGNSGGEHFEFSMETCSAENFALIVGTIGSGKSSFLHTMILSAASRYSPEELRFALVDFKSEKDSPEFSQYRKIPGKRNLYIPHVDYLLVNGKAECAFDLFGKIEAMKRERSEMLDAFNRKYDRNYTEVSKYNQSEEVLSGKAPKIPQVFFIIDEYNVMIAGGINRSSSLRAKIVTGLTSTVKAVRAYGIGIILCGQSVADELIGGALDQMRTRISLRNESENDYSTLMHINMQEARKDLQYLTDKGYAIFSTDGGNTRRKVRLAYSGYTGCDAQLELAEKIRNQYGETIQVEAGSEASYPVYDADGLAVFHDEKGQGEEKFFHIPIGVASASMLKVSLEYYYGHEGVNYFAFANKNKLYTIERNAIFGYLNKMATEYAGEIPKVSYMAIPSDMRGCLGTYFENRPFLKEHINAITERSEMAKEILRLSDLYEERKKQAEKDNVDFAPIFAVIHDIEWLRDENPDWVPSLDKAPEEPTEEKTPAIAAEFAGKNIGSLAAKLMAGRLGATKPSDEPKKTVTFEKRFLNASDYCDMLGKLYARGNRYGIFLLAASENYSPIDKVLLSATDEADVAREKYAVYGSADEKESRMRDSRAAYDCIYVCPSETKVRAFEYVSERNDAWWNDLETKTE